MVSSQAQRSGVRSEELAKLRYPERLEGVLRGLFDNETRTRMSFAQEAIGAWFAANGDRERAHTTRVTTRRAKANGSAPIVVVWVDSHALATDLSANKDLYLARLANQGFAVAGIEFRVDRQRAQAPAPVVEEVEAPEEVVLSPEDKARIDELVAQVSDALKPSVRRALEASYAAAASE